MDAIERVRWSCLVLYSLGGASQINCIFNTVTDRASCVLDKDNNHKRALAEENQTQKWMRPPSPFCMLGNSSMK